MKVHDRDTLDEYLEDIDLTLLIAVGGEGSDAEKIHDCAEEKVTEEWRTCLLLGDTDLLTADEVADWSLGDERWVSLGVDDDDLRQVAEDGTGPSSALLLVTGGASILRIRGAFARGDAV